MRKTGKQTIVIHVACPDLPSISSTLPQYQIQRQTVAYHAEENFNGSTLIL
jgi:hypothetical protein